MRVMAGVEYVYGWIINAQEPRKKVRNISWNGCLGECDFFKELLGA